MDLNRIALGKYQGSPKERKYLAVVDGVVGGVYCDVLGLEDEYYLPLWKPHKIGAIIAGSDPIAVDTISARVMGYAPSKIPPLNHAEKTNIGTTDEIQIVGEKIKKIQSFVPLPKGFSNVADFGNPKLWPKISYSTLKTNLGYFLNKNKTRTLRGFYNLLKKHDLV